MITTARWGKSAIVLLISLLVLILCVKIMVEYKFPLPWYDEAVYLLPGINLAMNGSLISPEHSPSTPLLIMPHGWAFLNFIFYKVFGYSFAISKYISLSSYLTSFFLILLIFQEIKFKPVDQIVAFTMFLTPQLMASGLSARMESIVLLLVLIGIYYHVSDDHLFGGIFSLMATFFHPNGVYFFGISLLLIAFHLKDIRNLKTYKQKKFIILLGLSLAIYLPYSFYIFQNFETFSLHMSLQFARKLSRHLGLSLIKHGGYFGLILFTLGLCIKKNKKLAIFVVWSFPFYLVYFIGKEMWYINFKYTSFLFLLLTIANIKFEFSRNWQKYLHRYGTYTVSLLFFMNSIYIGDFFGMNLYKSLDHKKYLSSIEKNFIKEEILKRVALLPSDKHTVEFIGPGGGDLLFFINFCKKNNLKIVQDIRPYFVKQTSDIKVYIFKNKYIPQWLYKDRNIASAYKEMNGKTISVCSKNCSYL